MKLIDYIADMDRRRQLAAETGTSPDYLWQIATDRRRAGHKLARDIEEKSGGLVTKYDVRPDIFGPAPQPADSAAQAAA